VYQDHLRSSEAAVLLRHALGVFASLEPALVGDWRVRLRKFDSDFAIERDFYLHTARISNFREVPDSAKDLCRPEVPSELVLFPDWS
jgi:hypothetical protein